MLRFARRWPDRIWAIEGANGIGRPVAQRPLAEGERVVDVPAKLAARARVFDTRQGRKTDATDAHAVVMVALRDPGLRELSVDDELVVLRMLCDRLDELSKAGAQGLNRMHRLLANWSPGGRRLAAEQLTDLVQIDARIKTLKADLTQAVPARGSQLMTIHGIGPAGAARILADVGDIARFPDRNHVANQPRALHGRVRAAAPRHCRTRVLSAATGERRSRGLPPLPAARPGLGVAGSL